MKTALFFAGCLFALFALLDFTGRVVEVFKITGKWKFNFYPTMFYGLLSITAWTAFYVLTHQ